MLKTSALDFFLLNQKILKIKECLLTSQSINLFFPKSAHSANIAASQAQYAESQQPARISAAEQRVQYPTMPSQLCLSSAARLR